MSRTFKFVHPEKIESKLETFFVLKLDKSNDWIELHPENRELMSLTNEVLKEDK